MNCKDMIEMPELKEVLVLKAGAKGMEHLIRWIYFADCLQCIQSEYCMEDYIHGGEFVILTNRSVTNDNEKLMNLISRMQEYGIAALGINEGQISRELENYCEKKQLPLFELPEKFPLIDLSQILCQELVREESNTNSMEQLFSSILDAEHLNKEYVLDQARFLNINLTGEFSVADFTFRQNKSINENANNSTRNKENLLALGQKIRNIITMEFSLILGEKILVLQQIESVLVLIPVEKISEEELKKVLVRIVEKSQKNCNIFLEIGIGDSSEYLEEMKLSRKEASDAIKIAELSNSQQRISFYKDQGIYTLISQIPKVRFLDEFVENYIGKLIHADEIKEGNYCETLEKYLEFNCNAKETADAMFIHRNTLHYRLNKIRDILGNDFEDMNTCMILKLAFMIRNYRDWRNS